VNSRFQLKVLQLKFAIIANQDSSIYCFLWNGKNFNNLVLSFLERMTPYES
jgi:hypothetical protein